MYPLCLLSLFLLLPLLSFVSGLGFLPLLVFFLLLLILLQSLEGVVSGSTIARGSIVATSVEACGWSTTGTGLEIELYLAAGSLVHHTLPEHPLEGQQTTRGVDKQLDLGSQLVDSRPGGRGSQLADSLQIEVAVEQSYRVVGDSQHIEQVHRKQQEDTPQVHQDILHRIQQQECLRRKTLHYRAFQLSYPSFP